MLNVASHRSGIAVQCRRIGTFGSRQCAAITPTQGEAQDHAVDLFGTTTLTQAAQTQCGVGDAVGTRTRRTRIGTACV